jgi:hypothetical protein
LSNDKLHYPSILISSCVLPDDVLIEIFLRLPPQSSCLIRVAIVCKHWHSLIVSHPFLCCFQMFQRTPLLGIFSNSTRIPRFLPFGILLIVSQQQLQLSPYLTSIGMPLAAAATMSSFLAQVGCNC